MRKSFPEVKKKLGFGCMRFPLLDKEVDYGHLNQMIDAFMENGFNYFDTAHGYIDGMSETALRDCLVKRYPRESYVLTNKLSTFHFKKNGEIRPLFESQLEACGVEYFDFYLMHAQSAKLYEKYTREKAYETALELKAEGRFKHFGISFHDEASLLDRILSEHPEIEVVQIQLNYIDYDDAAVQGSGDMVNAIPEEVSLESYIRGKTFDAMVSANNKVNRALIGAAYSLGTNVEIIDMPGYSPLVNDKNMILVAKEAAELAFPGLELNVENVFSTGSTDMGDLSSITFIVHDLIYFILKLKN